VRLFVNFFQPSFKLAEKARDGATVKKRYHPAATPFQRLLADSRIAVETKERARAFHATLAPVALLREMRAAQQHLVEIADSTLPDDTKPTAPTLEQFLSGLRTAWKEGEVGPTARPHPKAIRLRRRPDPFAAVEGQLREWFETEPWRTSKELLERLQSGYPGGQAAAEEQARPRAPKILACVPQRSVGGVLSRRSQNWERCRVYLGKRRS
jgi:hypothetical protein